MKTKRDTRWAPESTPTFWVNHASRLITRRFEQRLRPLEFGFAYLPVVYALKGSGALLQKDLAAHAHVEQPTMAALLTRMERDGLISRKPHPGDKRASLVSLSAKAKARLPEARKRLARVAEQALTGLSGRERATLVALLGRVVNNLEPLSRRPAPSPAGSAPRGARTRRE